MNNAALVTAAGIILLLLFLAGVYFVRWVFGIEMIIELLREQTRLLRKLSESAINQDDKQPKAPT
jgi:hypothetical protein